MRELIIIAHTPTDAVNEGFIPAAAALGLPVILLTDCAQAHRTYFSQTKTAVSPSEIIACDVFNPLAIIDTLTRRNQRPTGIFSNSDHLQSSTAIVAEYFGLPGKDWRTSYRAKNKAEMRAQLASLGIDMLWHHVVCEARALSAVSKEIPFPCVVKPREGVASQQVGLAHNLEELQAQCNAAWAIHAGQPLLLEEYIEGPLYTLETLGDGKDLLALGGFQVKLSPPPHFIELEAIWGTDLGVEAEAKVTDIIRRFGICFGACHTEFVMTEHGPRLIEINYRNIGDYREFLLQDTLHIPLFEIVLRLYLGEPLPSISISPKTAWIRYFTANQTGKLKQSPAAFSRTDEAVTLTYTPLRQAGDEIRVTHSNKDYLGVLRGTSACAEKLAASISNTSKELVWEITP